MKPIKLILLCLLCCVIAPTVAQTRSNQINHEKAKKMLTSFYKEYVLRGHTKAFQLDATKYCTPRFLSILGKDYKKQLQEDYIISRNEVGLDWWRIYNFINGHQEGPSKIDKVVNVVHVRGNTYRINFIDYGYKDYRLIDLVKYNNSLLIDRVYK